MMKRLAALSMSLAACLDGPDDAELELLDLELPAEVRLDGDHPDSPLYGVVEMGTAWDHELLEVCWEASAYGATADEENDLAQAREWVRSMVLQEWGQVSRLRFTEIWQPCASPLNVPDIRIGHDPSIDGWSVHGIEAREIASGPTMMINLLGPDSPGCVPGGGPPPGSGGGGVIHACNGTWLSGDPPVEQFWVQAVALHVFGYAIGLRKDDVHPLGTPCAGIEETIDGGGSDGEALWGFDNQSVMYSCKLRGLAFGTVPPTLSAGDVRSINSLYPGSVRVFDGNFAGASLAFGPGYHTSGLGMASSIVVPPGTKVRACTSSSVCTTYTSSQRTLTTTFNNKIANVLITIEAHVAAEKGFIGAYQKFVSGTYKASQGQLSGVGNNAISSAHVAPGHAITLCDTETPSPWTCITTYGGRLGVPALLKLPGAPENTFAGWALDNAASYVRVSPRVVTHESTDFRGAAYSVAEGTYTISGGSTYLNGVRSLTVPAGLEAVACNGENPFSFPRPTCQTLVQSGALVTALRGNVKRLEVRAPLVAQP